MGRELKPRRVERWSYRDACVWRGGRDGPMGLHEGPGALREIPVAVQFRVAKGAHVLYSNLQSSGRLRGDCGLSIAPPRPPAHGWLPEGMLFPFITFRVREHSFHRVDV